MNAASRSGSSERVLDPNLLKVLSHPLRERILVTLSEREASPKELSDLLDADFDRVRYHVKKLKEVNYIELVGTDTRRGGTMHFYRAVVRPILDTAAAEQLPRLTREAFSGPVVRKIVEELFGSIEAGEFDSRAARSLLRMRMVLDEQGFEEVGESMLRCVDEMLEIQAQSSDRLAGSGETGFNVSAALLSFSTPE